MQNNDHSPKKAVETRVSHNQSDVGQQNAGQENPGVDQAAAQEAVEPEHLENAQNLIFFSKTAHEQHDQQLNLNATHLTGSANVIGTPNSYAHPGMPAKTQMQVGQSNYPNYQPGSGVVLAPGVFQSNLVNVNQQGTPYKQVDTLAAQSNNSEHSQRNNDTSYKAAANHTRALQRTVGENDFSEEKFSSESPSVVEPPTSESRDNNCLEEVEEEVLYNLNLDEQGNELVEEPLNKKDKDALDIESPTGDKDSKLLEDKNVNSIGSTKQKNQIDFNEENQQIVDCLPRESSEKVKDTTSEKVSEHSESQIRDEFHSAAEQEVSSTFVLDKQGTKFEIDLSLNKDNKDAQNSKPFLKKGQSNDLQKLKNQNEEAICSTTQKTKTQLNEKDQQVFVDLPHNQTSSEKDKNLQPEKCLSLKNTMSQE